MEVLTHRKAVACGEADDPTVNPHLAAWYEAFRAFGTKPKRISPRVERMPRLYRTGLHDVRGVHYEVSPVN
ncbi:hypothetical protein [Streptosporangium sp. NBC_01756]|uniref:hypothetical protein n=1 Tax=Streptosporangium sp. NBC_01756 TaxID=2975950 RepID=UPI002DD87789|nr:hypothetical protein [Streptosporangium sp. NBC_01756]WSC86444.1 hypothetical protein OIE48_39880 [Streptosporangium sp. NBC_01756]